MPRFLGIISDTHGLVRPEVHGVLKGCELIIHAGDIGKIEVLDELQGIAPVVAVRGNVDKGAWANGLPESEMIEHRGRFLYVLHDLNALDLDPVAAGIDVVIAGHSHKPRNEYKDGVLYFNPGSAGPRRFKLPIGVGKIHLHADGSVAAEWIDLGSPVRPQSTPTTNAGTDNPKKEQLTCGRPFVLSEVEA
ncbi:MAG: metallophosphoesterase family protein [Methylococcales bacterium]